MSNNVKTIKELAGVFNCSEGVLRGNLKKWEVGEIVESENNIKGLRRYLIGKFGETNCNERLGFDVNELEVSVGVKSEELKGIDVSELVEDNDYVLRNYHFETFAKFVGYTELNGIELWVFRTDKGYKAYSAEDINNGHFKIIEQ